VAIFNVILRNFALVDFFLLGKEVYAAAKGEPKPEETETTLLLIIEEMGFSIRTFNCLKRAGYTTLQDLLLLTLTEIKKIRNLGLRSSGEVAYKLKELGFDDTAWAECLQYWEPENTSTDDFE